MRVGSVQEAGVADYLGAFANASFGLEPIVAKYKADGDDYSYIMAEALADRRAPIFLLVHTSAFVQTTHITAASHRHAVARSRAKHCRDAKHFAVLKQALWFAGQQNLSASAIAMYRAESRSGGNACFRSICPGAGAAAGWQRRLQRSCTRSCGRSCGATRLTRT